MESRLNSTLKMNDSIIYNKFCESSFGNYTRFRDIINHPDFLHCLQRTILPWIPVSVLIFFGIFESCRYLFKKSVNQSIPFNFLNVAKLLCTVTLILLHLIEIIIAYSNANVVGINSETSTIFAISYIISFVLLLLALTYGERTSPTQFLFYLASVICGSAYYPSIFDEGSVVVALFTVHLGILVLLLVLNCFADKCTKIGYEQIGNLQNNPCPQSSASFASKLCFSWATPLMWKGYKNPLKQSHLWSMDTSLTSKGIVSVFDKKYNASVEAANSQRKNRDNAGYMAIPTNDEMSKSNNNTDKNVSVSVAPALMKTFYGDFLFGSVLHLIYTIMMTMPPQIMKMLISHVQEHAQSGENDLQYDWKGYFYAAILLGITVFQSLISGQYYEIIFRVGMKVRTVLISAIYRKSLRLSNEAKKDSSVGEIVNLMSIDVQRFMDLMGMPYGTINTIWSTPLLIILIFYFIYNEVGVAMFAGVGIILISLPITGFVASFARKLQLQQMKDKDKRIKLLNEVLSGMKVIKMNGWEPPFIKQTLDIRNSEIKALKMVAWRYAIVVFLSNCLPFLLGLSAFAGYIFINDGQVLEPQKAFVVLSYLSLLREPLVVLPIWVNMAIQASVSLKRINKFMNNSELDINAVQRDFSSNDAINIRDGTFKWDPSDQSPALKDINISVKSGSITAIVGSVGSGKSSLVSACLGDMVKCSGDVAVTGRVAYVPQQAWIQNATLQDNIIFGENYSKEVYDKVIEACALKPDLDILPGGDRTEIGEKGINLSGGQKQRVSLARAIYSDSDVYLLDGPLSAVDAYVGKHIFNNVIGHEGILKGKTRVLVTHGISFLPKVDHIIVIKDGKVSEQGSFKDLLATKGDFAAFLLEYMSGQKIGDALDETLKKEVEESLGSAVKPFDRIPSAEQQQGVISTRGKESLLQKGNTKPLTENKLIEEEINETGEGKGKRDVYWYYIQKLGWSGIALAMLSIVYKGSVVGADYWLSIWTNNTLGDSTIPEYRDMYLGVYGAFGSVIAFSGMISYVTLIYSTLGASSSMHKHMLDQVMRSPMSFFDTTPLGRIVNRFARDVDVCDNALPSNIRYWLSVHVTFVFTIAMIISIVPIIIAVIVPTTIVLFIVQKIYIRTSRQLKRLETVSRSPIYSHFTETLNGSSVIRSFNKQKIFALEAEKRVDENQVCFFYSFISCRWLAILMENMGNVITFMVTIGVLNSNGNVSPSEVGLIMTYALNVTTILNNLVVSTSDIETNIVAVERIMEYGKLVQEAKWNSKDNKHPPEGWPDKGQITFNNYNMRYREGTDLVLKSVNCDIQPGEKIGIVGRTGAGKSSLTLALLRLVEAAGGTIFIDNKDIASLGLHDLRKGITIIPQEPVLFSGTIRENLDPFHAFSDYQIWNSLQHAHLASYVSEKEEGLEHTVTEGGENLSVGQRQLLCLARALLKKTKILVLDEATAAVDLETDDLIQATITKEFKASTICTIAHRINTIMHYDKVMVLDNGKIIEFDTISNLLTDGKGIFYSIAKESGVLEK